MMYSDRKKAFEVAYVNELFNQPHEFVIDLIRLSGMPTLSFYRLLDRVGKTLPSYGSLNRPRHPAGKKR